ncbi:MAG TPA: phospholipid carrier-dependent glycosyltransferase, partial [Acidimicrobiia bacterium]
MLALRTWRLDEPAATYFDELYYPTTAEQFLQDWQYGIPADPFEWTHPHVAKYVIAGSIALLGDNRVTGFRGSISSTPLDVTFEPARPASQPATGDRVIAATGTDIRILPHGDIGSALTIPFAGASAVAFDDSDFLFVATNDGHISWIAGSDLASNDATRVPIHPLGEVGVPIRRLWAIGSGRLVAASPDGKVFLVDAGNGTILATAEMPGIAGVVRLSTNAGVRIAAATAQGLLLIDGTNLQVVQQVATSGVPTGLDLVDGSQFGWANRDLLPQPFVYVATNALKVDAIAVAPGGSLTPFTSIVMPGAVTDVKWNAATNYIHVLGTAPDAQPTVYVIDPHTNAVFADAELPFRPVAWTLDVQPNAPNLDRHRALVFSQVGSIAIVDVGGNAVATRLPGVIAGSLMAALLYLLARVLFRRRSIGVLLAIIVSLDGLLFTQSRIATNDTYLGLFIVAGVTLLAVLLRGSTSRGLERLGTAFGLPAVGVLLGLAFATKWVGLYAIGGAILILLLRSSIGRRIALLGMIALTGVFGYIAITDNPPNATFLLLMVGITALMGAAIARRGSSRDPVPGPAWVDPRRGRGLPFVWALVCLTAVPIVVYIATYIPWALSTNGQLLPGWPPGHTGQTLADLTNQMYRYHNELRNPNGGGAPWWSWPFDLKPIWGYFWTYGDGSQALTFMAGNPVLFWLSVPAVAFGAWQAWRRRSTALAFVLIVFFALWLPWARIDRVAYQYHYYTPLPFAFLLLAYFLAELWSGPSRRTWTLARVAFAAVLIAPAGLWVFRDQACAIAGTRSVNATAAVCNTAFGSIALPVGLWLIAAAIAGW